MPLYKGSISLAVYFWTEETDSIALEQDARDRLEFIVTNEGLPGSMGVREVTGIEAIADGWEASDLVPGTEDITGDERLSLGEVMRFAEFRASRV